MSFPLTVLQVVVAQSPSELIILFFFSVDVKKFLAEGHKKVSSF